MHDEHALFERFALEGFQSGLAWITVLRKRPAFRAAFADFDPEVVAEFGDDDVARLMADAGIVRNRAKIEATIANGRALRALHAAGRLARRGPVVARPRPHRLGPARHLGRRPGDHRRVDGAGQGAQVARVPVRRTHHRVRGDAGLRRRRRPPGHVPGVRGGRSAVGQP